MNLHRTTGKADWEKVSPANYNTFQKIAAATKGIVSPANVITVVGLGIVFYGLVTLLQGNYLLGLVLLAVGRLLDIVDGIVAESTGTKSPLGELFDAAADKIGTILTIVVLIFANIAYWWVIVALILPQVIIPLIVWYKGRRKIRVHPTRQGKLSMAFLWVGIVGLILIKAVGDFLPLTVVTYVCVGLSLVLGLYALWQYATGRNQD